MDMTRRLVRLSLTANALAMLLWILLLPRDVSILQWHITIALITLNALGLIVSLIVWRTKR